MTKLEQAKITFMLGPRIEMIRISPGTFEMGSPPEEVGRLRDEGPIHTVTISDPFLLATTPITQAQYAAVIGNNPSAFKSEDHPVECVSWDDAMRFCEKISERMDYELTLPTEAQWEYACRAGSQTRYYFGDDERNLGDYAWYGENSGGETHPVGQKKPNAWGLYDMYGNVWEWCRDNWHGDYKGAPTDGSTWEDAEGRASGRVVRGGSGGSTGRSCQSAYRYYGAPSIRRSGLGFRIIAPIYTSSGRISAGQEARTKI